MQTLNNPTTNIAGCSPCTPEAHQRTDLGNLSADLQHFVQQLAQEKARRYLEANRRGRLYLAVCLRKVIITENIIKTGIDRTQEKMAALEEARARCAPLHECCAAYRVTQQRRNYYRILRGLSGFLKTLFMKADASLPEDQYTS